MSKVEENRLYAWNTSLEKRATAVRFRQSELEDKRAVCLQLEASLVELANENDATERLLAQKERYIASRNIALEQATAQRNTRRNVLEGERKKSIMEAEQLENTLDNEWRVLEKEVEAAELEHHQRMNRFQQQLEDLDKQESDLMDRLRQLRDVELGITNQLRQLKQKEDQLRSLTEMTLQQMRVELREREALLDQWS